MGIPHKSFRTVWNGHGDSPGSLRTVQNELGESPCRFPTVQNGCGDSPVTTRTRLPVTSHSPSSLRTVGKSNGSLTSERDGEKAQEVVRRGRACSAHSFLARGLAASMEVLKVRVENGKIIGAAARGSADGTELELCLAAPQDDMSRKELAALQTALDAGWRSMEAGRVRPADEVVAELRSKR